MLGNEGSIANTHGSSLRDNIPASGGVESIERGGIYWGDDANVEISLELGMFLMFLLYIFAAVASWRMFETVRRTIGCGGSRERAIWLLEVIILLALAASTAMNGPGLLTATFRRIAMDGGWYAVRAPVQSHLIALSLGGFAVAAVVGLYWSRAMARPALLALLASMLLITFIVVRAISLHAMDEQSSRELRA
jgi:hypothetical protein